MFIVNTLVYIDVSYKTSKKGKLREVIYAEWQKKQECQAVQRRGRVLKVRKF